MTSQPTTANLASEALISDLRAVARQLEVACARFEDCLSQAPPAPADLCSQIRATVCQQHHVTLEELDNRRVFGELVFARHLAIYACRHWAGHSIHALARMFRRNHATIWAAVKSFQNRLDTREPAARQALQRLALALNHPDGQQDE